MVIIPIVLLKHIFIFAFKSVQNDYQHNFDRAAYLSLDSLLCCGFGRVLHNHSLSNIIAGDRRSFLATP